MLYEVITSIIIPTKNGCSLLRQCIDSILDKTTYQNYDIAVIDNGSDEIESVAYINTLKNNAKITVIKDDRAFNFSSLNNKAVSLVSTEFICLLNNDIEVSYNFV